jgi:hypothetical protein
MLMALQIAVGLWLGVLFLAGTFAVYFALVEKIERNKRRGYSWRYGLFR